VNLLPRDKLLCLKLRHPVLPEKVRPRGHPRPCREKLNPEPAGHLRSLAQFCKFPLQLLSLRLLVNLRRESDVFERRQFLVAQTGICWRWQNCFPRHPAARSARPPRKNERYLVETACRRPRSFVLSPVPRPKQKKSARCGHRTTPRNVFCARDSRRRFHPATHPLPLAPICQRRQRKVIRHFSLYHQRLVPGATILCEQVLGGDGAPCTGGVKLPVRQRLSVPAGAD